MRKEDKGNIIAQLGEVLNEYAHFYLVDVTGLNAATTSAMRRKCFQSEIKMVVVKNTLLHKALEAAETDYTPLYDCLKGTTAVLFANTANAEEGFYVGADQLEALTAIKSKDEVIAEIVALLQSPAKNVLSALQSGGNTIHGVLKTLGERPE